MPSEAEIEAAANAMLELEGGYIVPWRGIARAGLDAAEAVREDERRKSCRHVHRIGTGTISSDGSGWSRWHCPECGASDESEWPGRAATVSASAVPTWCETDDCECYRPECAAHGCMDAGRAGTVSPKED